LLDTRRAPIVAGAPLKVLLPCAVKHGVVLHVLLLLLRVCPPSAGTALGSRASLSIARQGVGWLLPGKGQGREIIQRVLKIKHVLLHLAHATVPTSLLL